ncbi:MAG TPA: STAS domain-containing protein [Hanamia sp.]|nr:STAS domain-containing protein [Hanamia sp.]
MKVKIDTKEKMHVITIEEEHLTENMTDDLVFCLQRFLGEPISNVVISLKKVKEIESKTADALVSMQQRFYDENHSMVFCNLQPAVYDFLDKNELLEIMNVTPTESEAWDIVQMEEIERELM